MSTLRTIIVLFANAIYQKYLCDFFFVMSNLGVLKG
jgi:hypothetical protein